MHRNLLLCVTAFASAMAAPAFAETRDHYEVRIPYGDLDLTTVQGADALLDRIEHEAQNLCETNEGRMQLSRRTAEQACMVDFQERALSVLGDRFVTQRFAERNGAAPIILAAR